MSDTQNPKVNVVNKSGYAVEIIDVFNQSGSRNGILTYKKLATLQDGASQLVTMEHRGSQIMAMYSGPVAGLDGKTYYRFPIAVRSVNRNNAGTDFQIGTTDVDSAVKTQKFVEYVYANPNSKLAKDFNTALGNSDDQKTAVAAFFAATGNFKGCTLDTWSSVSTWQQQFFSAWQGTYYIYSNPDDATKTPIAAVAQLTIQGSAQADSATLTLTDAKGNVPANAQTITLTMAGDGTMVDSDQGAGTAVCLQPVWMNLTITDGGKTEYVLGSGVAGTIGSAKVAGTRQKQDLPDTDANAQDPSNTGLNSPAYKIFSAVWDKLTGSIGLLISVGMLVMMYKQTYKENAEKKNALEDKRPQDPDDKPGNDAVDDQAKALDANYPAEVKNVAAEVQPQLDKEDAEEDEDEEALVKNEKKQGMEERLEEEDKKIEDATEDTAPSDATETALEKIEDEEDDLPGQDVDVAQGKMEDISTSVDSAVENSRAEMSKSEESAMEDVQKEITEEKQEEAAEEKVEKEHEDEEEKDESEETPDDEERDMPSEPVEAVGE